MNLDGFVVGTAVRICVKTLLPVLPTIESNQVVVGSLLKPVTLNPKSNFYDNLECSLKNDDYFEYVICSKEVPSKGKRL